MPDRAVQTVPQSLYASTVITPVLRTCPVQPVFTAPDISPVVPQYYMRGRDVDAPGPTPVYRFWWSPYAPDWTGAQYNGPSKSGPSPLQGIVLIRKQLVVNRKAGFP